MGQKKETFFMSYLNSATIVGFVGADPEQRQARNNGSKFTVLSVATQRSWKNAEDEWVSKVEWHRVAIFRSRLAEAVLNNIKKGAHVLVEGSLVSIATPTTLSTGFVNAALVLFTGTSNKHIEESFSCCQRTHPTRKRRISSTRRPANNHTTVRARIISIG
jgi:single-strand DNA-binding protein